MKKLFNFKKIISMLVASLFMFMGIFCMNKSIFAGEFLQKTDSEIIQIIEQTKTDKSTFLAITDMSNLSNLNLFFRMVAKVFKYPSYCVYANVCGFSSCQQDLSWIKEKRIIWILKGFTKSPIPKINKEVLKEYFEEAILPYWSGASKHNPNPKPFAVYYS